MLILNEQTMKHLYANIIGDSLEGFAQEKIYEKYVNLLYFEVEKIKSAIPSITIDAILYSKYYWFRKYIDAYIEKNGTTDQFEDQAFKILEEIDMMSQEPVDWDLIEKIKTHSELSTN